MNQPWGAEVGKVIKAPFGRAHEMYAYATQGFPIDWIAQMFETTPFVAAREIERYVMRLNRKYEVKRETK